MSKSIFKTGLFALILVVSFAYRVQAISLSIGDPKEIYTIWNDVRAEANKEYDLLKKELEAGPVTDDTRSQKIYSLIRQLDALSAQFTEVTKSDEKSVLTVKYPNGGETLECGKTYTISWATKIAPNSTGIEEMTNPTYGIYLSGIDEFGGSYISRTIVTNLKASDNTYDWTIPCDIRVNSYKIRIVANPESKITNFEDSSNGLFKITSNVVLATIDSISVDKSEITSGEEVTMTWSGSNVSQYKIYFGTEYGTGVTFNGEPPLGAEIPIGKQTSAKFIYTNIGPTSQKVSVMLQAYGSYPEFDARKEVSITVAPQSQ